MFRLALGVSWNGSHVDVNPADGSLNDEFKLIGWAGCSSVDIVCFVVIGMAVLLTVLKHLNKVR